MMDSAKYYEFKEYNEFNIPGIQETAIQFSKQFRQAINTASSFRDWTPKDPFPGLTQDESPDMPVQKLNICFRGYEENIDLTNWAIFQIQIELFDYLFMETKAKTIDLSTWDVIENKSIHARDMFRCPLLEVLDISSLQNQEALQAFFKNAQLPKLQHVFVHDSSMADNLWECLCSAHLCCANARLSEAQSRGDSKAATYFQYLLDGECNPKNIPADIRDKYSPKTKIHVV